MGDFSVTLHLKILPEDEAYRELEDCLNSNSPVGWDTETNGQDIRDGRGFGFGISLAWHSSSGPSALYLPFRHTNLGNRANYNLDRFLPILQQILDSKLAIFHNAKFDIVSLSTFGLKATGRFLCTMVLAHLVNENVPISKSLDSCAQHYLRDSKRNDNLKKFIKVFGWGMLTPDMICEYAAYDAYLALKLYDALRPLARQEQLNATWEHKAEFTRCLIDMESVGIRVDQSLCREMSAKGHVEMQRIKDELGLNPGSRIDQRELFINQLKLPEIISEKTGNVTFDKNTMAEYEKLLESSNDSRAKRILEFRGWQKSTSSNYEPYISLLSPDGRLRPNYKMHGTRTGRLSCENPNLQQIPKKGVKPWNGKMKECFIPAEGHSLIGFDYSQLELRVATAYALEPSLIKAFEDGVDVFNVMTVELRKTLGDAWTRDDTKKKVYTVQYGGGIKQLCLVFKVSSARASEMRQNYYETYPKFREVTRRASDMARRDRKIKLWSGRYRHFLYPEDESFKAFNSVIQGGSADVVERAMLRIWKMRLPQDECRMLLQVHDELIFEVRTDLVHIYKPIILEAMTKVDYHPMFERVKFAAEFKYWGEK